MPAEESPLVPAIKRLIADMLSEIGDNSDRYSLDTYLEIPNTSPIVGPALQVLTLMGVGELGEYTHPDPDSQALIRKSFELMGGSLALSIEELQSCFPLGYSVAQWGPLSVNGEWLLDDIQILHPSMYKFEGRRGAIENIVFKGDTEVRIPYPSRTAGDTARVIHCVNARHLSFRDPVGIPALRRVAPAWEAWKILIAEMLIAGKRQATPIIVGYTDSAVMVPLLNNAGDAVQDADGNPVMIQAPRAMMDQLEGLDNRSVITTDLRNRIEALAQQTNGAIFFEGLKLLQQLQLVGLLMPESILTATGAGDSNLNAGQRSTVKILVRSLINQIKEQILDQPVRWLLTWNKGEPETLGEFVAPEENVVDDMALMGALNNAVSTGFFAASDLSVLNRGRELMGLEPVENAAAQMSRSLNGVPIEYWQNAF